MKKGLSSAYFRRCLLAAILVIALLGLTGTLFAQIDTARYNLWANDALFEKLSGAAQNILIAKFGQKPHRDQKGNLVPPEANSGAGFEGTSGIGAGLQGFKSGSARGVLNALANQLVNNPAADATAQDTQSETALVLGSGSDIISGFNDSGSFIGGMSHFTGYSRSTNGGSTWTDGGTLPFDSSGDVGDPVLARNTATGRVYLSTLAYSGPHLQLFRSDNDAASWMAPVNSAPGMTGFQDKEWVSVDNYAGAGNGNVYIAWRAFNSGVTDGIRFTRSTDNGGTFGPTTGILIASPGAYNVQGAYVTVGTDHAVYVFWLDQSAGSGTPNIIRMRKSTDQGVSFGGTVTTVATLIGRGVNGDLTLPAGFRSNSFAQVAVNPVSGNLYMVYDDATAISGGDRGNIYFGQSTDGGATWSAATQVNTDGTSRAQYMPAIAVRPDGTGLSVTWYDNRDDPGDRNLARWGVTASISGSTVTFGLNFRISPVFPPVFGVDPVVNGVYMGDYDQMTADNNAYYTTWGDNRDNSIAVPSRKNANVRFASYSQAGPDAILDLSSVLVTGGNGNGQIDSNECNSLTVTVKNNGGKPVTGVTGTLTTATPGVTISNATQPYPDMSPGGTGTNAAAFQVVTTPSVACGTAINFTLTMSYTGGSDVINFAILMGGANYIVASSAGSIVPGTTDIGNHCDDCVTTIALPFPVKVYASTFSSVNLSSNGNAQFASSNAAYTNACLPAGTMNATIFPHWDDLMTSIRPGDGIFTSVSGVSPSRVFNIHWRTTYYPGTGSANFELRLHENSTQFEMVYDTVTGGGNSATIGVQQGTGPSFTQYACNSTGSVTTGRVLTYALPACVDGGGPCTPCQLTCPQNISVSNDPGQCGAAVNYPAPTATGDCGTVTCTPPPGSFFPVGTTTVNCQTSSGSSCSFNVSVADTQPPSCSVSVNPSILTPANHKLKNIAVKVTAANNCPGVTCALTSVTSSEADTGLGRGDLPNDIQGADYGTCDTLITLRAERFSTTSDRIYTITYTVTDAAGHASTCSATVRVPLGKKGLAFFDPTITENSAAPDEPVLAQNFPNPFNSTTQIFYALPVDSRVILKIYNTLGQPVQTLVNEVQSAGYKSVEFDAGKLASDVYIYKIDAVSIEGAKTFSLVRKMILMR